MRLRILLLGPILRFHTAVSIPFDRSRYTIHVCKRGSGCEGWSEIPASVRKGQDKNWDHTNQIKSSRTNRPIISPYTASTPQPSLEVAYPRILITSWSEEKQCAVCACVNRDLGISPYTDTTGWNKLRCNPDNPNQIKQWCVRPLILANYWVSIRVSEFFSNVISSKGHAVVYLVEALWYKPEGRGFDSRWGHWIFFHWPNPSSRTVALGSTQPLTEMSTRYIPGSLRAAGA
jgi:hypothetical protein